MTLLWFPLLRIWRCILLISFLAVPSFAARQAVINPSDSVEGSLRFVLDHALPGDTVVFNIPMTDTVVLKSEIAIAMDILIDGTNLRAGKRAVLTVDIPGSSKYRVFNISQGNVSIKNLIMQGGCVDIGGVALIKGVGTIVTIDSVIVKNGKSTWIPGGAWCNGGGIFKESGTLIISNSLIYDNSAFTNSGGGIFNSSGDLTILNSSINNNSCISEYSMAAGAGVFNRAGNFIIQNSTVANNCCSSSVAGVYIASGKK